MAIDSESKRWSMLSASSPIRTIVFNPDTSGLAAIERATVLQRYAGIAWGSPVAVVSIIGATASVSSVSKTATVSSISKAATVANTSKTASVG